MFYETSAKVNRNKAIEEMFGELAQRIREKEEGKREERIEKIEKNIKLGSSEIIDLNAERKKGMCC